LKRWDKARFISALIDSEGEAEETRVWLELAFRCGYVELETDGPDKDCDRMPGQLVRMIEHPEQWTIRTSRIKVKDAVV